MTQVAVIGNGGGGKSTLCRKLSRAKGLPLHVVDKIQFKPGWVPTPAEEIRRWHEEILAQDRWIIDGWGGWDNIEARFAAADTLIFVDHPLYIHYLWAMKRQLTCLLRSSPDGPEECPMLPVTWRMLQVIHRVHHTMRPRLLDLVERYRGEKQIFHIRSPRELRRFLQEHCA